MRYSLQFTVTKETKPPYHAVGGGIVSVDENVYEWCVGALGGIARIIFLSCCHLNCQGSIAIPASTAPSETVFSTASKYTLDKRMELISKTAAWLGKCIFLRHNAI